MQIIKFFQIFHQLTERDLVNLTGSSVEAISMAVRKYAQQGILVKEKGGGGKNQAVYSLRDYSLNLNLPHEQVLKNSQVFTTALTRFIDSHQGWADDHTMTIVLDRITKFKEFMLKRQARLVEEAKIDDFEDFDRETSKQIYPQIYFPHPPGDHLDNFSPNEIPDLDGKIIAPLIELIQKRNIFFTGDATINALYAHFIVQQYQTQESLSKSMASSLSTVSRNLSYLIEKHLVRECDFRLDGKKVYEMEELELPQIPYDVLFFQKLGAWKKQFVEQLRILEDPSRMWLGKAGFPYIHCILQRVITEIEHGFELYFGPPA
jgi:DNA-binding transcriptional regulator GbsR (MarR family)